MNTIDLREWDVSYTDFVNWSKDYNIDCYAIMRHHVLTTQYEFTDNSDLVAFKLKFKHKENSGVFYSHNIPGNFK